MKKFFSIIMILLVVLSMTACSSDDVMPNESVDAVYTDSFTVTKLEVYLDGGDHRYIMAVKNDDVALLFRTNSTAYLQYDIGDVVSCEVKHSRKGIYLVRLDNGEDWFYTIKTIGLEN